MEATPLLSVAQTPVCWGWTPALCTHTSPLALHGNITTPPPPKADLTQPWLLCPLHLVRCGCGCGRNPPLPSGLDPYVPEGSRPGTGLGPSCALGGRPHPQCAGTSPSRAPRPERTDSSPPRAAPRGARTDLPLLSWKNRFRTLATLVAPAEGSECS